MQSPQSRTGEAALVCHAQTGDRTAFGTLYERFSRMIHGVLLAHVSHTDAEDLMQDVFVRAMEQLPTLREPEAFGGWLASIARRIAFDHHRRALPVTDLRRDIAGGPRPDGEALDALAMIQSLPEAYRETLVLRFVEGMTGPEIAARTGLDHGSVRVNLCRGMKLLRMQMDGQR